MKKIFACFVIVLCFGFAPLAFGEEKQITEERYHTGIGIRLWQVSKSTVSFGLYDGGEISNEQGQITGRILVSGKPLENSPAAQAGLKDSDVILAVDGANAQRIGVDAIVQKIKNGQVGETVHLTVGKLNPQGEIERTFDVNVPRGLIDSVAWLHKDYWFTSSTGDNDGEIEAAYKLTEDTATQEFTYYYRVANKYNTKVFVRWKVLDTIFDAIETAVPLEPGETREFKIRTKLLPVQRDQSFCVFRADVDFVEFFTKDDFSDLGGTLEFDKDKDVLFGSACMSPDAFIPRLYLEQYERYLNLKNK